MDAKSTPQRSRTRSRQRGQQWRRQRELKRRDQERKAQRQHEDATTPLPDELEAQLSTWRGQSNEEA